MGQHAVYRLADERCGRLLGLAEELLRERAIDIAACPRPERPSVKLR
ncbi:MAG: hypothetical protein RMK01_01660 [Thermomicrobium sp.]|nr:hypothetical protein [Thermomicrobium sp.]MDW8058762.1 hypothetical protein [Thermomicrobium sp.]